MSGEDVLTDPRGAPNMVETTALIDDTVGGVETSESRVCDDVAISEERAGPTLSAEKDAEEVVVEFKPSMEENGAIIPNGGWAGSSEGKG